MREIEHLKGLDLIVEERLRQVEQLGYDVPHDHVEHDVEELLAVGKCYIELAELDLTRRQPEEVWGDIEHPFWPDTSIPWKPESSALENAAKGAAFVAAALDLMHAQILGEV